MLVATWQKYLDERWPTAVMHKYRMQEWFPVALAQLREKNSKAMKTTHTAETHWTNHSKGDSFEHGQYQKQPQETAEPKQSAHTTNIVEEIYVDSGHEMEPKNQVVNEVERMKLQQRKWNQTMRLQGKEMWKCEMKKRQDRED